jgi:hypothetical protein
MAMYRAGYVPDLVARERDGFSDCLFGCQSEKEGKVRRKRRELRPKGRTKFLFSTLFNTRHQRLADSLNFRR